MPATPRSKFVAKPFQNGRADPRLHPRYPLLLDLHYKFLKKSQVELFGFGRTLNISSEGILFEAKDVLEIDGLLDDTNIVVLDISWPFMLSKFCGLKLRMRGRIVRIDAGRLAAKIDHHEFHTAGARDSITVSGTARGALSG